MASIAIQGISKRYGAVTALDTINLQVEQGEFLTLLGPSGSGKTTLLTMIAGLDNPDQGNIVIGGRDLTHVASSGRNIGLVFQSYALFPHMTVFDNVAFPLRVRKKAPEAIRREVLKALEMVKLQAHADRKPSQLSGGQQQRVALARAIVFEPSILLLDEPLGALDKNLREDLQFELRQLHRTLGITTVMVTHDQEEAMSLSDRIAVFNSGRIEQVGAPEHIYRNPANAFVANFFGSGNLMRGTISRQAAQAVFTTEDGLSFPLAGDGISASAQPAEVMLRAESIRLGAAEAPGAAVGEIVGRVYLGAIVRYRVKLPSGRVLAIQNSRADGVYEENDRVSLSWQESEVRVVGSVEPKALTAVNTGAS